MKCAATLLFLCIYLLTGAQEQEITASDVEFADLFGYDVAIDGDYAIIGAPLQSGFGTNKAGAAYIFQQIGGVWTQVKKLVPPWGGNLGDQFGYSVDITGGYAIVGAINVDYNGKTDMGAAYVFSGSGSSWYLEATLRPSDGDDNDHFGRSVGISGTRAVVGVPDDDDHGSKSGSAYFYEDYYANGWIQIDKVTASDADGGDVFGADVSISGDYAAIGAPSNVGVDYLFSGAVYVFKRWGSSWTEDVKLVHDDADVFDRLGESVDIFGPRIIAGAPFAADKTGSAYIFSLSGYNWQQTAKLTAADGVPHDKFGNSVGITDGFAAVGAARDDDNGTDSGSMYIFEESGGTAWSQLMKHTASDGAEHDLFGIAVDIDGDHAIAGAPYHTETASDEGAAYIYGPALAMSCVSSMSLDGTISSGTYQAGDQILVTGTILTSSDVTLRSQGHIELKAGFELQSGATLLVSMAGCQ
ncbi:MAG: FG-GAP repeat protein [Saprospiraceae bacterium]|nr:FG-GAP repeat protein [Saprospiraceae bacterium]